MGQIATTLHQLGMASDATRERFSNRTRDVEGLPVFRDSVSGVIYIDDFYTGDATYNGGEYRQEKKATTGAPDFERANDAERRFRNNRQFISGRNIADFGSGHGEFLKLAAPHSASAVGIELEQAGLDALAAGGIRGVRRVEDVERGSADTVFMFHVLEHLPQPIETLIDIRGSLKPGGTLVVEVPHARDLLLTKAHSEAFTQFTLWSQHLILHTRESLRAILIASGYRDVVVHGIQRYPLSNHLTWLSKGERGGHKGTLSVIDSPELTSAYEAALQKIDATDTLMAYAQV